MQVHIKSKICLYVFFVLNYQNFQTRGYIVEKCVVQLKWAGTSRKVVINLKIGQRASLGISSVSTERLLLIYSQIHFYTPPLTFGYEQKCTQIFSDHR